MPAKKRKLPDSFTPTQVPESEQLFSKTKAVLVNAGIEKMRQQIFRTQFHRYGGTFCEETDGNIDLIIVDDKMDSERLCRILKWNDSPPDTPVIKSAWLSQCLKQKQRLPFDDFKLEINTKKLTENKCNMNEEEEKLGEDNSVTEKPSKVGVMFHANKKPRLDPDSGESDYEPSDEEPEPSTSDASSTIKKKFSTSSWICAQSSKNVLPNFNKHITDKLEEMVKTYQSTSDKWRAYGYQKAIQVLRKHPKQITTWKEARSLPQVGTRLADKIWEIAESGELRKLNEFKSSEDVRIMEMFGNVWGAGAHTSKTWYQQGFRSLEDLKTKANLTHQQKIGLNHYDDFLDRMPREEAGQIEAVVREAAESLLPGVVAQACGSYRRGRSTCGDVDVLVTHPDGKSHKNLFGKLLAKLKAQGFLTDDLVTAEDNGNQKKYLGVCKLPGENKRHRRIDIIVVPYSEYACALVYFTGSAHFNRSLRHLAKKMGMSLSEHSLNTGVVRQGAEKIYEGTPVPTPAEESVFVQLGVPYRPPEERDH